MDHESFKVSYEEPGVTKLPLKITIGPKILLNGTVDHANFSNFQGLYDLYLYYKLPSETSPDKPFSLFLEGAVKVKHLNFPPYRLHSQRIQMRSDETGSFISLSGKEAEGQIFIPYDILSNPQHKIRVNLSHLHLTRSDDPIPTPAGPPSDFDMTRLPSLSLHCHSLESTG